MNSQTLRRGFTLIEMLIVISILAIIAGLVIANFSGSRGAHALNNTEDAIVGIINEARSRTLSGDAGLAYGVHFESSRVVLFAGSAYVENAAANKVVSFDSAVMLDYSGLSGGRSEIQFAKQTGETDEYGTLIVELSADSALRRTITIAKTGLVDSD